MFCELIIDSPGTAYIHRPHNLTLYLQPKGKIYGFPVHMAKIICFNAFIQRIEKVSYIIITIYYSSLCPRLFISLAKLLVTFAKPPLSLTILVKFANIILMCVHP